MFGEGANHVHVDFDQGRPFTRESSVESSAETGDVLNPTVRQPECTGKLSEVGHRKVNIVAPAAIVGVLDIANNTVSFVIHQQDHDVGALLGQGCQLP